jgi:imidazolonepropionase-like amidohydrolase
MGERVVFAGGLAFDGHGDVPSPCDVAIQDGLIVEMGVGLAGDRSVDVTGRTILPGFIDCHAHVAMDLVSTDEQASRSPTGRPGRLCVTAPCSRARTRRVQVSCRPRASRKKSRS